MSALGWILAAAVLTASAPAETTVQKGEDVVRVARRALGDEKAASELRALNKLSSNTVEAGTVLRLPGPDRALALSALSAAKNALQQAGTDAAKRDAAKQQIADAEALFAQARYEDAARAADGAWRLVSTSANGPTQFSVQVASDGKTEVKSKAGNPVRVEAEGSNQPVYPGGTATVVKGEVPRVYHASVVVPLDVPTNLAPPDGPLELEKTAKGVGPLVLTWAAVPRAVAYEVEVVGAGATKPLALKVDRPEARIASLAPGRYEWTVRAVAADGTRSEKSVRRAVELVSDGLKLEVKGAKWK